MRKEREFELPGYQDLTKDQDDALALPKDGINLVIGGPGTGKSVVVLLRTMRHEKEKDDYRFLVYNRVLHKACRDLAGRDIKSATWNKWFTDLYQSRSKENCPTSEPSPGRAWREIDWDAVRDQIRGRDELQIKNPATLLIDEGQDMPPDFYASLLDMGFDRFFVAADQNQQIDPTKNSSRQDIEDNLDIDPDEVVNLRYNHRNTYEIALLARHFYTDRASDPPELPARSQKSSGTPLLYEYVDNQFHFDKLLRRILKTVDIRPNRLIGVICPNNQVREKYHNGLLRTAGQMSLDNGVPLIKTYPNEKNDALRFDLGGIIVINFQSCKGLEFDFVFLADIDRYKCRIDAPDSIDRMRKNFYVMTARAKERLVMLKVKGRHCQADEHILPQDENILSRESQNE